MQVAILGCGHISNTHALALTQQKQTIAVVVDKTLSLAQSFAERWNVARYSTNFDDVLADDIDCVHICTPPVLHYDMAKKIILAGKNVVCEKPLCLDAAQAKELMELAQEKQLITAVNFNVRYHEACQRAKKAVMDPSFGPIHLIHGSYLQEFHALPAEYMWRYMPELAGKMRAVTEIGSHWVDLAQFLTGLKIIEVSANFGKFNPDRYVKDGLMHKEAIDGSEKIHVDSEDAAVISLRFSNGAIGSLLLSEVSHGRSNCVSIEISGAIQSLWWNSENPYCLNKSSKFKGVQSVVNAFGGGFPNTFSSFFEQVYSELQSKSHEAHASFPTFYDGYVNAAVCEAIYQSAQNNSAWTEVK